MTKRIGQLPDASGLTGSEFVPIEQAGGTRKATLAQITGAFGELASDYYVEAGGSDTNDGLTIGTAFRTFAPVTALLSYKIIPHNVTIHVGAGSGFGKPNLFRVQTDFAIAVEGTVTDGASRTISAVTNQNPATNTRGLITADGTGFTTRQRVRFTSGAINGYRTYVTRAISTTQANVMRALHWPGQPTVALTLANIPNSTTFVSETLDSSGLWPDEISLFGSGSILIRNLVLTNPAFGSFFTSGAPRKVVFDSCSVDAASVNPFAQGAMFSRCLFTGSGAQDGENLRYQGCLFSQAGDFSISANLIQENALIGAYLSMRSGVYGSWAGDIGIFDGTSATNGCVRVLEHAYAVRPSGTIWGADNSRPYGVHVVGPHSYLRGPITGITIAGTTAQARINTTDYTYASMPQIDASRFCGWFLA